MPAWSGSGEGSHRGLQMATFLLSAHKPFLATCSWREIERERARERGIGISPSRKATNPVGLGTHPYDLISPNFLNCLSPKTVTLGLGLQRMDLGGT